MIFIFSKALWIALLLKCTIQIILPWLTVVFIQNKCFKRRRRLLTAGEATSSWEYHILHDANESVWKKVARPDESNRPWRVVLVIQTTSRLDVISKCLLFVLLPLAHDVFWSTAWSASLSLLKRTTPGFTWKRTETHVFWGVGAGKRRSKELSHLPKRSCIYERSHQGFICRGAKQL